MNIVTNQFPLIVFRDGDKYLWNPVQKKTLKNRPEERVRLRVVEYLLQAGWSKHRISAEEGISSIKKGTLRTDLICYTKDFTPFLLVECKAPSVNISNQTAEQIAVYNSSVKADFLLMTNGQFDFWYTFKDKPEPVLLNEIPKPFQSRYQPNNRSFEYWVKRGFAGKEAATELRKWLAKTLNNILKKPESEFRYLAFKNKLYDFDLNHYYQLISVDGARIAVAFVATAYGDSRLIAILNKDNENKAVLEINLDLLFKKESPNASLYNADGRNNLNIQDVIEWNEGKFNFKLFAAKMKDFFEL